MERIPRIKSVVASGPWKLDVRFENEGERDYDCAPLLERPND